MLTLLASAQHSRGQEDRPHARLRRQFRHYEPATPRRRPEFTLRLRDVRYPRLNRQCSRCYHVLLRCAGFGWARPAGKEERPQGGLSRGPLTCKSRPTVPSATSLTWVRVVGYGVSALRMPWVGGVSIQASAGQRCGILVGRGASPALPNGSPVPRPRGS